MSDTTSTGAPETGPPVSSAPTTLTELFAVILRRMLLATLVIGGIGALLGWLLVTPGSTGVWGAVLGGGIGLLFCGTTVVSMLMGEGRSPQFLAIVMLGGWLVKMILVIVALVVLRDLEFYDRYVLAGTLGAIVVASLAIEVLAIRSARIPILDLSAVLPPTQPPAS